MWLQLQFRQRGANMFSKGHLAHPVADIESLE